MHPNSPQKQKLETCTQTLRHLSHSENEIIKKFKIRLIMEIKTDLKTRCSETNHFNKLDLQYVSKIAHVCRKLVCFQNLQLLTQCILLKSLCFHKTILVSKPTSMGLAQTHRPLLKEISLDSMKSAMSSLKCKSSGTWLKVGSNSLLLNVKRILTATRIWTRMFFPTKGDQSNLLST